MREERVEGESKCRRSGRKRTMRKRRKRKRR
jgi:hypothetical protein